MMVLVRSVVPHAILLRLYVHVACCVLLPKKEKVFVYLLMGEEKREMYVTPARNAVSSVYTVIQHKIDAAFYVVLKYRVLVLLLTFVRP